jgi:hypothetical protein
MRSRRVWRRWRAGGEERAPLPAQAAGAGDPAPELYISNARDLGMDVSGFLMMSHMAPAAELPKQAKIMEDAGANCVYVTDSGDRLTMNDMRDRVRAYISKPGVLDVAGVANGELRSWFRGLDARWYGLVSFPIMWASWNPSLGLTLVDQLVPTEALKLRRYNGRTYRS